MMATIPLQRPVLSGVAAALFDRLLDEATARLRRGDDYDTVVAWWGPLVGALFDRSMERTAVALLGGAR